MKVLLVKTNDTVSAVQIFTQRNNEVSMDDIRKLVPRRADMLYLPKISRLAFLYVMFVEKDIHDRPINKLASSLVDEGTGAITGDVVIARTNHLGFGAKLFALEDSEIQNILDRLSKLAKTKVELIKERK